jgi:broad specificity phosphatase PhoE
VLQAIRLGAHLAATDVKISHIFSSDLQRAAKTADAIRVAQATQPREVKQLLLLREQDFGFCEGKQFFQRPKDGNKTDKDAHFEAHRNDPGFRGVESKESMRARVDAFIDGYLLRLFEDVQDENSVVVVAHGIILSHLWKAILKRFHSGNIAVATGLLAADRGFSLEHLGGWSNTGYLDLEIKPSADVALAVPKIQMAAAPILEPPQPLENAPLAAPAASALVHSPSASIPIISNRAIGAEAQRPIFPNMLLVVKAVNSLEHLKGLKKTGGGIGSSQHDSSQKAMDSFFKKRQIG